MTEKVAKGTWVEIHTIILLPGERAQQIPEDTQAVPLEMYAKGFLVDEATLGENATITTAAGRRLTGTLGAENPPYDHGFGAPVPELSVIGIELRTLLREAEGGE